MTVACETWQTLTGDIDQAKKTMHNYYQVWRQYGAVPEFYSIPKSDAQTSRDAYPLRPGDSTHRHMIACISRLVTW